LTSLQNRSLAIMWFRRDLRLHDNAALYHALRSGNPVLPVFIFDRNILDDLDAGDRRVSFIYDSVVKIRASLAEAGAAFEVRYGYPEEIFRQLVEEYPVSAVFTNRDYEPYSTGRDTAVKALLNERGIEFADYKDQVIFDRNEVVKDDGRPYTIFTPYSKRWKLQFNSAGVSAYPTEEYFSNFHQQEILPLPSLVEMGFMSSGEDFPAAVKPGKTIREYEKTRDFPALEGTTRLGVHLRFGTISVRELVNAATGMSEKFLGELIWREFYQMILMHFPHIGKGRAFRQEYDNIRWRNNEYEFERWCQGKTGYPIVDAGMRQLNQTGFMHNRVRMITASFLSKHLLVDWRWGEAYFASLLLDYEFASNNGGWQWAAGSGCDAAPYFRIFNPSLQAKKFDPDGAYIRQWVPEINSADYPAPIVEHELARKRCLEVYAAALQRK
jgi:deoxyribodipyrimidine photo-lyase